MWQCFPLRAVILAYVYDGAIAEVRDICNYWSVENMGYVSAKIDEQKTDATLSKIQTLVKKL